MKIPHSLVDRVRRTPARPLRLILVSALILGSSQNAWAGLRTWFEGRGNHSPAQSQNSAQVAQPTARPLLQRIDSWARRAVGLARRPQAAQPQAPVAHSSDHAIGPEMPHYLSATQRLAGKVTAAREEHEAHQRDHQDAQKALQPAQIASSQSVTAVSRASNAVHQRLGNQEKKNSPANAQKVNTAFDQVVTSGNGAIEAAQAYGQAQKKAEAARAKVDASKGRVSEREQAYLDHLGEKQAALQKAEAAHTPLEARVQNADKRLGALSRIMMEQVTQQGPMNPAMLELLKKKSAAAIVEKQNAAEEAKRSSEALEKARIESSYAQSVGKNLGLVPAAAGGTSGADAGHPTPQPNAGD